MLMCIHRWQVAILRPASCMRYSGVSFNKNANAKHLLCARSNKKFLEHVLEFSCVRGEGKSAVDSIRELYVADWSVRVRLLVWQLLTD